MGKKGKKSKAASSMLPQWALYAGVALAIALGAAQLLGGGGGGAGADVQEKQANLPPLYHGVKKPVGKCARMLDSGELTVGEITAEIKECGYAHLSPGLIPLDYISEIYKYAQQFGDDHEEAYRSNARGGRRDVIPAFEGPFASPKPYTTPQPKLWQIMKGLLGEECCELVLLELKYANGGDHDFDGGARHQSFHTDNFVPRSSMPEGGSGHYYIFVALHEITSGQVEVLPRTHTMSDAQHDKTQNQCRQDPMGCAQQLKGHFESPLPAGSIMIHDANVIHRGLLNRMGHTRYFMRYDIIPRFGAEKLAAIFPNLWHGQGTAGRRNEQRRKELKKHLETVEAVATDATAGVVGGADGRADEEDGERSGDDDEE